MSPTFQQKMDGIEVASHSAPEVFHRSEGIQVQPHMDSKLVVQSSSAATQLLQGEEKRYGRFRGMRRRTLIWTLCIVTIVVIVGAIVGGIVGSQSSQQVPMPFLYSRDLTANMNLGITRPSQRHRSHLLQQAPAPVRPPRPLPPLPWSALIVHL